MNNKSADSLISRLAADLVPVRPIETYVVGTKIAATLLVFCLLVIFACGISAAGRYHFYFGCTYFLVGIGVAWLCAYVSTPGLDDHLQIVKTFVISVLVVLSGMESFLVYTNGLSPLGDYLTAGENIVTKIIVVPAVFSIVFAFCRRLPMQRVEETGSLMIIAALSFANGTSIFLGSKSGYVTSIFLNLVGPLILLFILKGQLDQLLRYFLNIEKRSQSKIFR